MNILITGSTGTVGSYLASHLAKRNHRIKAHYRSETKLVSLKINDNNIEWTKGDLFDFNYLESIFENIDLVIHCAALIDFTENEKELYKVNVELTKCIVDQCIESNTKLIFISSTAALGKKKNSYIVSEENHQYELEFYNAYGQSKKWAEMEVWRGIAEGIEATIFNPGFVLADEIYIKGLKKLFSTVRSSSVTIVPKGLIPYIDICDIAEGITNCIENNIYNEQFVLVGGTISYYDLFKKINPKAYFIFLPFKLIILFTSIVRLYSRLYKQKKILTSTHVRFSFQKLTYDNTKSVQKLNLNYTDINISISKYCKYSFYLF